MAPTLLLTTLYSKTKTQLKWCVLWPILDGPLLNRMIMANYPACTLMARISWLESGGGKWIIEEHCLVGIQSCVFHTREVLGVCTQKTETQVRLNHPSEQRCKDLKEKVLTVFCSIMPRSLNTLERKSAVDFMQYAEILAEPDTFL